MSKTKCLWCGKLFDTIMASCGTGHTWSLFECPHCEKLMAVAKKPGSIIPIEVINDPEVKIEGRTK